MKKRKGCVSAPGKNIGWEEIRDDVFGLSSRGDECSRAGKGCRTKTSAAYFDGQKSLRACDVVERATKNESERS